MCTACQIDTSKTEAFAQNLVATLNSGALTLMIAVGHRTGLFDVMSTLPPSTSVEIARAAKLNERYVREWLGAMTTGRIVECRPNGPRFSLPAEHAACLTRAALADNIAVFSQYISVLGSVEDEIVECFRRGGGVPYESYKRFHEVMAEDSGQSVLTSLIDVILPIIPGITEKLTSGISVLDIGCGSGRAINLLARNFPNSRFTGIDLSPQAIANARAEAQQHGLTNVEFITHDLSDFNNTAPVERYDFITAFDAIHDQARPDNVLRGINRALKKDGVFLMQDINASSMPYNNMEHPLGTLLYAVSCMHCMTVSLAQNGMGLGAMWGREKAVEMLTEAGFSNVIIRELKHDLQNCHYIARKK